MRNKFYYLLLFFAFCYLSFQAGQVYKDTKYKTAYYNQETLEIGIEDVKIVPVHLFEALEAPRPETFEIVCPDGSTWDATDLNNYYEVRPLGRPAEDLDLDDLG
jgi:hypothetical protein